MDFQIYVSFSFPTRPFRVTAKRSRACCRTVWATPTSLTSTASCPGSLLQESSDSQLNGSRQSSSPTCKRSSGVFRALSSFFLLSLEKPSSCFFLNQSADRSKNSQTLCSSNNYVAERIFHTFSIFRNTFVEYLQLLH